MFSPRDFIPDSLKSLYRISCTYRSFCESFVNHPKKYLKSAGIIKRCARLTYLIQWSMVYELIYHCLSTKQNSGFAIYDERAKFCESCNQIGSRSKWKFPILIAYTVILPQVNKTNEPIKICSQNSTYLLTNYCKYVKGQIIIFRSKIKDLEDLQKASSLSFY